MSDHSREGDAERTNHDEFWDEAGVLMGEIMHDFAFSKPVRVSLRDVQARIRFRLAQAAETRDVALRKKDEEMSDQLDGDAERLKYLRMEWDTPERHEKAKCDGEFNETFLLRLLRERDAEIEGLTTSLREARIEVFRALDGSYNKSKIITNQGIEIDRLEKGALEIRRIMQAEIDRLRSELTKHAVKGDAERMRKVAAKWLDDWYGSDQWPIRNLDSLLVSFLRSQNGETTPIRSTSAEHVVEAARKLKFGVYPAHGSGFGFVWRLVEGDPGELSTALAEYDAATPDSGWHLIETAPARTPRTERPNKFLIGRYGDFGWIYKITDTFSYDLTFPNYAGIASHWQALPPPPVARESKG